MQPYILLAPRRYEELAVKIAHNPEAHLRLREKLVVARRADGGLFDTWQWVRDYERGLKLAWEAQHADDGRQYYVVLNEQRRDGE